MPQVRRRLVVLAAVAALIAVAIIGYIEVSGGDEDKKTATPAPAKTPSGPTLRVVGNCVSGDGMLFGTGSGFTPNDKYVTEVWRPDGKPYINIRNPGTASGDGTLDTWRWPCYSQDPPGTYQVRITDLKTGKDTGIIKFEVGKPETDEQSEDQAPSGQMS